MDIEQLYARYTSNYLVDTDTRQIRKGSLFFALKGDRFNGNKFAIEALEKGADYAVIDEKQYGDHPRTILVDDVLETLQKLANYHRKKLHIPIIALTGSNGKTTTKELINVVLSKKYNTAATSGNLNNHIGVPLTLLSMTAETEIGIVEMGANHLNEIKQLCSISEPDFGYITNFGKAHLEGFGGFEGVVKGKSELYNFLRATDGMAFVFTDDKLQVKQSTGLQSIPFNAKTVCFIEATPFVHVEFNNTLITSHLVGKYNYPNIAVAIAIGSYFKVSAASIKEAIEAYIPDNNRSQIIQKDGNQIILDAYNANPSSMEAALENFSLVDIPNKIAFLGDMLELGAESNAEHQKIADLAASHQFSRLYLIGKAFSTTKVKNAFKYVDFDSFKKSNDILNFKNATILIKGSRGIALERILNLL